MLLDANVLMHAYDGSSPHHEPAKAWLAQIISKQEHIALGWVAILAFLRIMTDPRMQRPRPLAEAMAAVADWLAQPCVSVLNPGERHWSILTTLLPASQARGPLVMDAHLAALAIEHGATLCTNDRDFTRFRGLRTFNPFETA